MFVDPFPVDLPSSSDPANFDARADAYYGHLPTFVAQLNAQAAALALSAAPPISIPYAFSATTTVSDPGPGIIRLNAGTQTSATALLADLVDGVGATVTGLLDQFDDSSSTIKGYLRISAVADPAKWLVFAVTAVASPSGYRNITVQAGVGSSASPFADTDLVLLSFVPKGDKGDPVQLDVAPDFYVIEEGATPTPTAGNRSIRQLDTVYRNRFGWAFSSYVLTLPAGDYMAWASCPSRGVGGNSAFLRNVTDSTDILEGLIYAADNVGSFNFPCRAEIELRPFTLPAQKNIRLEHLVGSVPAGASLTLGASSKNAALAIWKRN